MKSTTDFIHLYKQHYIERDYEQLDLFRLLATKYAINKVVYPGSYVQISPSFIFPDVVYIDSDSKAKKFFADRSCEVYIETRKEYEEETHVAFYGIDYKKTQDELHGQCDLLISQYAGFISDTCKRYLKIGGILLVNNSHGDAGLASIDNDYRLIAAVHKSGGTYRLTKASLEKYFVPKKNIIVTKKLLYETGKGVGYTKTAPLYIFKRVS